MQGQEKVLYGLLLLLVAEVQHIPTQVVQQQQQQVSHWKAV
jgi:hypothetical protein